MKAIFRQFGLPLGVVAFAALTTAGPVSAADSKTVGFVVRDWFTAVYNTKFMDECPEGLTASNDEIYMQSLTKEQRGKFTGNGYIQLQDRQGVALRRGPNKEEVCVDPTGVKDPPMKIIEGKYSFGANLDGTEDGRATAKSCKHDKFISAVDGKTKVDNQMYRLIGCTYGFRKGGLPDTNANELRGTSGLGMILIELTGVDDRRNDDDVTVSFYRSIDQYAFDGNGKPLPYTSYRVEMGMDGKPAYGDTLKGKLKDGVLTTERGTVRLPFYGNYAFMSPTIKDFGLVMQMAADGRTMTGQITGYFDSRDYVRYANGLIGHSTIGDSCPAYHEMGPKLADGYPDPVTGECTAFSSAFDITGYAAFVVRPKAETRTSER